MIDEKLLRMLRCIVTGKPLRLADPALVNFINESIDRGEARDRLDQRITTPIDSGLVCDEGELLYPVRGGIVCMVADEAVVLTTVPGDKS